MGPQADLMILMGLLQSIWPSIDAQVVFVIGN